VNPWLAVLIAVVALGYFAYEAGYTSGKDRALRDNRKDAENNF